MTFEALERLRPSSPADRSTILGKAADAELRDRDVEEGWDILVEKKKTGPAQFNVEYVLLQLELEKRPLTDKERETIAEIKPIDEIVKRQTADEQKAFIEQAWLSDDEPNVDTEAVSDLD